MVQQQKLNDFSIVTLEGDFTVFLEQRIENNGDGNPEFVGYNREPNAATSAETWFIVKYTYAGTSPTRYQLPDDGAQFKYAWDDRATLFT